MKEIRDILSAFDNAQEAGKQTALATVVHVDGSAYRRPGARMLITEDGELTGAISGGCLEKDALRKAFLVIMEKKSKLVTYDTSDEDDATMGMMLGCNGIIQVLIEPIDTTDPNNPIQLLKQVISKRQLNVLITLFSLEDKRGEQHGTCLLVAGDGNISGDAPVLQERLLKEAEEAFRNKHSSFKNYTSANKQFTAFIELVKPPLSLVIVGAGNDVLPLVQMADILGWETTVVDGRADYAKEERFVAACRIIVARPEKVLEQLVIDEQTVFLLMTHNYQYDFAMLRVLLAKKISYIGSLGPRKKMERMIKELEEEGVLFNDEQLSTLYGPVGLDIGADTPEEIALSILAEIKAVFALKSGQSLRQNNEVIHSRSALLIRQADMDKD